MRLLLLLVLLPVIACSDSTASKPSRSKAERAEIAEQKLATHPAQRAYKYETGDLQIFEIPVKAEGAGFVDSQRCFLWRDKEFRNSTLSCGQMPEVILSSPSPKD